MASHWLVDSQRTLAFHNHPAIELLEAEVAYLKSMAMQKAPAGRSNSASD
jgi:hypothetical protein